MHMRAVLLLVCAAAAPPASAQIGERVPLGRLAIDRTEVTVSQFGAYATSRGVVTAAEREGGGFEYGSGWERRPGWTVYRPFGIVAADAEPAVHVTWHEARAYCAAAGGRLPTAEEWHAAAFRENRAAPPAPFAHGRVYPYPTGDTPAGANTSGIDRWPRSAPAGETAPGVNGLYDMGGNVWEWVGDVRGDERRTMGGSWWYGADQMTAKVEAFKPATFYAVYVGFRCAYDLGG